MILICRHSHSFALYFVLKHCSYIYLVFGVVLELALALKAGNKRLVDKIKQKNAR